MKKYSFKKEERLCSKRLINSLFGSGSSFVIYPFRVVFSAGGGQATGLTPVQVLVSVSKRRFRKAVDRNRLKRLVREVYRLHKTDGLYKFLADHDVHLLLVLQYVGKEELPFSELEEKMQRVFSRLKYELAESGLGKRD